MIIDCAAVQKKRLTYGNIWLKDVCAFSFKELSKPIACVLVLSSRDKRRLDSLLELRVAVVVIRRETFFYPFYIVWLTSDTGVSGKGWNSRASSSSEYQDKHTSHFLASSMA